MVEKQENKPAIWFNLKLGEKTIVKFKNIKYREVRWHFVGLGKKPIRCTALIKPDGKISLGSCALCDAKIKENKGDWAYHQYYYNITENGVQKVLGIKKTSQKNLNNEIDAIRRFAGDSFDISELEFIVECPPNPMKRRILTFRVKAKEESKVKKEFVLTDGEKALFQNIGMKEGQEISRLECFMVLRGQNIDEERAREITENLILGGKIHFA